MPGFRCEVVDTVGAGDSFAAAFIAGWIRGGVAQLRDAGERDGGADGDTARRRHTHSAAGAVAGDAGGASGGAALTG